MTSIPPSPRLRFHPAEDLLQLHAGGSLPLARRVLVESHLAHCPDCRAAVGELARPGGGHLRALAETVPPPAHLWSRIAARIAQERQGPRNLLEDTPLPAAAIAELPPVHEPLQWGALGESSRLTLLMADPENALELYLIRNPPASTFPHHRHLGGEDLLILQGGLEDDFGHYGVGDFQHYEGGTAHGPVIDPGEECWAITCVEGGVAFGP